MTNLGDYMKLAGTDAELARLTGLSRSTVSRIRRGLIDPPLSTVGNIVAKTGGYILVIRKPQIAQEPTAIRCEL